MKKALIATLIVIPLLAACGSAPDPTPTPLPPPATLTPVPTPTPIPPTAIPACSPNLEAFPYEQVVLTQYILEGRRALNVWFVNPNISRDEADFAANLSLATTSSLEAVFNLLAADPCIAEHFDTINPIVVDASYNSWFAGVLDPAALPGGAAAGDTGEMLSAFKQMYTISASPDPLAPPSENACDWPTAKENIRRHFSPTRQLVDFYFIIDQDGANVWAQWDGPTDLGAVAANVFNITGELNCLHPRLDRLIFIVVDQDANANLIAVIRNGESGFDLQTMEVLSQ